MEPAQRLTDMEQNIIEMKMRGSSSEIAYDSLLKVTKNWGRSLILVQLKFQEALLDSKLNWRRTLTKPRMGKSDRALWDCCSVEGDTWCVKPGVIGDNAGPKAIYSTNRCWTA